MLDKIWDKKWTKFWTKNWTNIFETFGGGGARAVRLLRSRRRTVLFYFCAMFIFLSSWTNFLPTSFRVTLIILVIVKTKENNLVNWSSWSKNPPWWNEVAKSGKKNKRKNCFVWTYHVLQNVLLLVILVGLGVISNDKPEKTYNRSI